MKTGIWLVLLLSAVLSGGAAASIDTYSFQSIEQEQQYRQLTEQLRCPKCQNNSIADSNAIIAGDMRAKVYQLMQQGKSRQEIIDYMVARYGNFVTYQPPLNPLTLILWAGPLIFILVGAYLVIARAAKRTGRNTPSLSVPEQQRLNQLLAETEEKKP